jgi:GTP-binding protein HflX
VSLIGYTNAGKSTLFNRLAQAGALTANRLFATLDPLTRRVRLVDGASADPHLGPEILVSDTVGFVRDLPHGLIAAFRATLEETAEADLLLHVVDADAPDRDHQIAAVNQVLSEIGAADVPQWQVMNKIDRTGLAPGERHDPSGKVSGFAVSALTGSGLADLRRALSAWAVSISRDPTGDQSTRPRHSDPSAAMVPAAPSKIDSRADAEPATLTDVTGKDGSVAGPIAISQ